MEKIKYYIEKYRLIVFLIIILTISIILTFMKNNDVDDNNLIEIEEETIKEETEALIEKVKVDIKGRVKKPGVYEMDNNSRVIDVINKAGGLLDDSNTEYINLSKKIVDEMLIIIYSNNDLEKFKETDKQIIYIEYECICPDNKNDACINENDTVNTNGIKDINESQNKTSISYDKKISINTATTEELMTLTGIGESKARAIIEYREKNGDFRDIEDIKNVSGIGEAAYSKIKDNIKL